MSQGAFRAYRVATSGQNVGPVGGLNSWTFLKRIVIGTGAASAVVTVYDGQSASGTVIATIDASAKGFYDFECVCKNGVFVALTGGNADTTVIAGG